MIEVLRPRFRHGFWILQWERAGNHERVASAVHDESPASRIVLRETDLAHQVPRAVAEGRCRGTPFQKEGAQQEGLQNPEHADELRVGFRRRYPKSGMRGLLPSPHDQGYAIAPVAVLHSAVRLQPAVGAGGSATDLAYTMTTHVGGVFYPPDARTGTRRLLAYVAREGRLKMTID